MSENCLECVHKHVSQAMILHEEEVPQGYPDHINRVTGHLAEAARESLPKCRELATLLRKQRLKVRETPEYLPPYADILAYIDALIAAEDGATAVPAMPASISG